MRLIDADVLKCKMQRFASGLEDMAESMGGQGLLCKRLNTLAEGVQRGIGMLDEQPSIEERKTGKWLLDEDRSKEHVEHIYICSACHNNEAWGETERTRYCSYCGAEMENWI